MLNVNYPSRNLDFAPTFLMMHLRDLTLCVITSQLINLLMEKIEAAEIPKGARE